MTLLYIRTTDIELSFVLGIVLLFYVLFALVSF